MTQIDETIASYLTALECNAKRTRTLEPARRRCLTAERAQRAITIDGGSSAAQRAMQSPIEKRSVER